MKVNLGAVSPLTLKLQVYYCPMNAVGGKFGLKRYWLLPRADCVATALTRNKSRKVVPPVINYYYSV